MLSRLSMRGWLVSRVRTGLACGLAIGLLATLSGCAAPPTELKDRQTASDQTDANRRAQVRLELASAYFSRGQNNTALDEVKQALAADPNLVGGHNLRGLIYGAMGEPALAEDSFRQALRQNARDPDSLHNYGWFLCQQKRFAEADAQFALAAQQPGFRDLPRTLMAQGVCQARGGRWPEAERSLVRAYELDPSSPAAAVNLAEVLHRRGEDERARFYVRRVNMIDELVSAQSLWLALRIERSLGQTTQQQVLGSQLRNRFPQSPEALLYERGQFDE